MGIAGLVSQPRGTQRYHLTQRGEEDALTRAITDLATQYGRLWLTASHHGAALKP